MGVENVNFMIVWLNFCIKRFLINETDLQTLQGEMYICIIYLQIGHRSDDISLKVGDRFDVNTDRKPLICFPKSLSYNKSW